MTEATVDVVDILTADHHEFLDLVGRIRASEDAGTRRDLTDTVIAELMRHAIAEEMYVYPAMREHLPGGDESVQHDVEEHQQLEEAMKALESLDTSTTEFRETLDQLETILRDHVADEEADQFPALRAHIPRERLQQIGHEVEVAKQIAPTRPHPGAPHSPLFHKTVGPGVGLVDRLRDTLSGRSANT